MIRTNNNTYFKTDNRYRKSSTSYIIGDIVYSKNLPNHYYLECVAAGTSGSTEPIYSTIEIGQYVQDGTVTWIIDNLQDTSKIGNVIFGNLLYPRYIQANGALLFDAATNYPRLIKFLTNNTSLLAADDTEWASNNVLYVYDDLNDILRVPNMFGRVLQGDNIVKSLEAGLPNITGNFIATGIGSCSDSSLPGYANNSSLKNYDYESGWDVIRHRSSEMNVKHHLNFNASWSNILYGASTTVQPLAAGFIPQIKY